MAQSPGETPEVFPTLTGAVQALTIYAGVPTITVFPVGLVGLWMQQWMDRRYDLVDAWYIVSLVPRTVVIGFGVEIVLASLFFTALLAIVGTAIAISFFVVWDAASGLLGVSRRRKGKHYANTARSERPSRQHRKAEAVYAVFFVVVCIVGAYYLVLILRDRTPVDRMIIGTSVAGGFWEERYWQRIIASRPG